MKRSAKALWAFIVLKALLPFRATRALGEKLYERTLYVPIAGADAVEGARGTGNVGANVLEPDFDVNVYELEPDSSPFTLLTSKLDKQKAINPKFTWFEDAPDVRFDRINNGAGYNAAATDLIVDTQSIFHADDIIYVSRTGESLRVTASPGGGGANHIDVVRAVGSTAAALVDNDELIITGSAAQEGALDKAARSRNPAEVFNYCQIIRTPIEETGTKRSSKDRTQPSDWDRARNHAGIEHAKDWEYAGLLGHPSINTSGAHPRRTTGGIRHYNTQNITDVGGTMTEDEFFAALRNPFRYSAMAGGRRVKMAFAAAFPVEIVNRYPRSKLIIEQGEETYGIRVVQLISPQGIVNFVTHWLLEGDLLSQQIEIVDLKNVGFRYLHGDDGSRDTHVRTNIQAPGADTHKDEILTEGGFKIAQPLTHGRIINITG